MKCCILSLHPPLFLLLFYLFIYYFYFLTYFFHYPLFNFRFFSFLRPFHFIVFFQGLGSQTCPATEWFLRHRSFPNTRIRSVTGWESMYNLNSSSVEISQWTKFCYIASICCHLIHSVRPKKWNTDVWRIRPLCDQEVAFLQSAAALHKLQSLQSEWKLESYWNLYRILVVALGLK
jgi:hypothetical protein